MSNGPGLDFEVQIAELEGRIQELERQTERTNEIEAEIRSLRLELVEQLRDHLRFAQSMADRPSCSP